MSMEAYEDIYRKEQLYRELDISENQIESGKTRGAREGLSDLRKKYGL